MLKKCLALVDVLKMGVEPPYIPKFFMEEDPSTPSYFPKYFSASKCGNPAVRTMIAEPITGGVG